MNVRMVNCERMHNTQWMLHELDYRCVYVLSHTFCHFALSLPLFFFRFSSAIFSPRQIESVDFVLLYFCLLLCCYAVILYHANMQKCHFEWQKRKISKWRSYTTRFLSCFIHWTGECGCEHRNVCVCLCVCLYAFAECGHAKEENDATNSSTYFHLFNRCYIYSFVYFSFFYFVSSFLCFFFCSVLCLSVSTQNEMILLDFVLYMPMVVCEC